MAYPTLLIVQQLKTQSLISPLPLIPPQSNAMLSFGYNINHQANQQEHINNICQCKAKIICHSRSDCYMIILSPMLYFSVEQNLLSYMSIIILSRKACL